MKNGSKRRVCIVGLGIHGQGIANRLLADPDRWLLVALVDASVAALMRFRWAHAGLRIPFYRDVGEALALAPDIVIVATQAPSHVSIAKALIAQNFSEALLIEKPLSTSVAEAESLLALIDELAWKGRAAVGFHRRCSSLYASVERRIRSREFGALRSVAFNRPCKLSMNGSHFADLANWFVASRPILVTAQLDVHSRIDHRGSFYFDPPGLVEVAYENGLSFKMDTRQPITPEPASGLTVRLEDAELWVDAEESRLEIRTREGVQSIASEKKPQSFNWIEATARALVDGSGEFRPCSVPEALDSLAVIVAAHHSHRNGGSGVPLPLSEREKRVVLRVA